MLKVEDAATYAQALATWRAQNGMTSELKWQRIQDNRFARHQAIATEAINRIRAGEMSFRSIVLEKSRIDYRRFHAGDKELAFHKFMYQLLFHCFCKRVNLSDRLVIFVDHRYTSYNLGDLKDVLNSAMRGKGFSGDPVSVVQAVNSKKSQLMQINDILLGAVGFHANGRDSIPSTKTSKIGLAAHVAQEVGWPHLRQNCNALSGGFGVWQFQLS